MSLDPRVSIEDRVGKIRGLLNALEEHLQSRGDFSDDERKMLWELNSDLRAASRFIMRDVFRLPV